MERYRSGHNEAVLKTVCPKGRVGSNPTLSARHSCRRSLYRLSESTIWRSTQEVEGTPLERVQVVNSGARVQIPPSPFGNLRIASKLSKDSLQKNTARWVLSHNISLHNTFCESKLSKMIAQRSALLVPWQINSNATLKILEQSSWNSKKFQKNETINPSRGRTWKRTSKAGRISQV